MSLIGGVIVEFIHLLCKGRSVLAGQREGDIRRERERE